MLAHDFIGALAVVLEQKSDEMVLGFKPVIFAGSGAVHRRAPCVDGAVDVSVGLRDVCPGAEYAKTRRLARVQRFEWTSAFWD
jgi:hypothetical protein